MALRRRSPTRTTTCRGDPPGARGPRYLTPFLPPLAGGCGALPSPALFSVSSALAATLFIDLETYSTQDLRDVGAYRYAEDCEVLLVAWAIDDGPVSVWDRTAQTAWPPALEHTLTGGDEPIVAHNASFDRAVIDRQLVRTRPERWQCSMALAQAHGFPGGLGVVAKALGFSEADGKFLDGRRLVNRFCKPAPKNHQAERYTAQTHPEDWAVFVEYARQDVETLRRIWARLPRWNWDPDEYHLDQRINDRGMAVDVALAQAGAAASEAEQARLAEDLRILTGGVIARPTQRERVRQHLASRYGVQLADTQAATLTALAEDPTTPPTAAAICRLVRSAGKASTAKFGALAHAVSADGRFRGGLQYCGAARTRRWSGRKFQAQNLPSRIAPAIAEAVEPFIAAIKAGVHDVLFDDVMSVASAAIRGLVVAPEGRQLVVADLANIEGRIAAWLAGEHWKLDAFAAFDAGRGPDLYTVTAGQILGQRPEAVSKSDRNVFGKVPELALGYGGGVGALQTFARGYGVCMADHAETIRAGEAGAYQAQAAEHWETWGAEQAREAGVPQPEWLACETVKLAWRARHPGISGLWRAAEGAARSAIAHPGRVFTAGPRLKFSVRRAGGAPYLLCRLPSGRFVVWFEPRIAHGQIVFQGLDPETNQWGTRSTYGGRIVENACQSLARDVLAASMPAVEAAGFEIVLTVHDEIVAEAALDRRAEDLAAIMATVPPWAEGLPLAADGFTCTRYRKD